MLMEPNFKQKRSASDAVARILRGCGQAMTLNGTVFAGSLMIMSMRDVFNATVSCVYGLMHARYVQVLTEGLRSLPWKALAKTSESLTRTASTGNYTGPTSRSPLYAYVCMQICTYVHTFIIYTVHICIDICRNTYIYHLQSTSHGTDSTARRNALR